MMGSQGWSMPAAVRRRYRAGRNRTEPSSSVCRSTLEVQAWRASVSIEGAKIKRNKRNCVALGSGTQYEGRWRAIARARLAGARDRGHGSRAPAIEGALHRVDVVAVVGTMADRLIGAVDATLEHDLVDHHRNETQVASSGEPFDELAHLERLIERPDPLKIIAA